MDHGFALPGPARQALDLGTCGETEAHGTAYSRDSEGSSKSLRYTLDPVRCSVNQRRVQVRAALPCAVLLVAHSMTTVIIYGRLSARKVASAPTEEAAAQVVKRAAVENR